MSTLLEQASLVMIPSGYKEDVVYSQIPTNGNGDLSFTRASNGTRINSAGLVEVCPWNLMPYSETFNDSYWQKVNGTITSDLIVAPNGTTTADLFTITNNAAFVEKTIVGTGTSFVFIPNTQYTLSCYFKKGSIDYNFKMLMYDGVSVTNSGTINLTTPSSSTVSYEDVGNGWYRFYHTFTSSATASSGYFYVVNYDYSTTITSGTNVYLWGAQVVQGATAKPYFPTTDRLNVPRLTYQNGGGGCPSLLLEKQSTNKWYYSEQFDNAEWLKTECTITANAITSPDGTQNADKITDTTANNEHRFRATSSLFTISTVTTFSIFAKAGEYSKFGIADLSNGYIVKFDLSAGTIISTGTDWSNAKIENFGNGWYRLSATRSVNATCGYAMLNDAGDFVFTGTGTKGVYIWGAQVEESSYVTSYIVSTSSSATRVADACFKTGISSLIGQTEGVIFYDGVLTGISNLYANLINSEKNVTGSFAIGQTITGSILAQLFVNSSSVIAFDAGSYALGTRTKIAFAYKSGSFALYANGTQLGTSAATFTPVENMDDIYIGDVTTYFNYKENTQVNQVALFKTRLTNAELASLTTI